MSSNPPREPRPWSLRRRLIAQVLALLSLVCLIVGVVTELALRDFLVERLDSQLTAVTGPPPPPDGLGLRRTLVQLVEPDRTVIVRVVNGQVALAQVLVNGELEPLTAAQGAVFTGLAPSRKPVTVSVPALGDYRVFASGTLDGGLVVRGLSLAPVNDTLWRLGLIFGGVGLGALVLAGGVAAFTIRRTLRPLDRVAVVAARVTSLPLDRGEVTLPDRVSDVDTRTEVGKVGAALNRMLDHFSAALAARQRSESRVRRFVADASHELRTPLASIRGYAELIRRSDETLPPDTAFAVSRVESESARMTTLVEDLLLLARLDEGRQVVHAPVELSGVVADAVADAHVAGPDHRWLLDLPGDPIRVHGDEHQLHQVVGNLLANARTHTPPGTVVRTALSVTHGVARLTVTDDGPGIPPAVLPEVFERFARGDTSRSRYAGSTGLGLAIVSAVVAAHRGHLSVRSHPGETVFTVALPATP